MKSIVFRGSHYALAFFVVITTAIPAKSELWGCSDWRESSHPHPIELVSDLENGIGSIEVQGLPAIATYFGIEGFSRVWRWYDGPAEEYAFSINRDDSGYYFVFLDDKLATAKETYSCHKH